MIHTMPTTSARLLNNEVWYSRSIRRWNSRSLNLKIAEVVSRKLAAQANVEEVLTRLVTIAIRPLAGFQLQFANILAVLELRGTYAAD